MQISWLGYNSFRITSGGVTVITNPVEKAYNFKINKQGADIVVASHMSPDNENAISGTPFVIDAPGEYEVKSIFVTGARAAGGTVYLLTVEGVTIAFIGGTKIKELSSTQSELLEGADVLLVPVGGGDVCSSKEAVVVINNVEPRIVVPSCYKVKGSTGLDSVDGFLKEYSAPTETIDKLKLTKKELLTEDTRVVVLQQS